MDYVFNILLCIELVYLLMLLECLLCFLVELGGLEIWIKWDDCIGLGLGGNKMCKLEFLFGVVWVEVVDMVIMVGGV